MKTLLATTCLMVAAPGLSAETVERAIVAAMALAEKPNYSWTCTVSDDAQTYDIEGKTHGGLTWQRQPMPDVVAKRLGRDAGRDLESIFNAPLNYVIATDKGWKTLDELPKRHPDWDVEEWYPVSVPLMRTADMPADGRLDRFGLPPTIWVPVMRAREEKDDKVYSNMQFALALPHQELAVIVSSYTDFKVEGNEASGTLSDLGSQLLLVHDGHEYLQPVVATGRFKLWLHNGIVSKYTIELAGILIVDRKPVYVRQKAMTTIKAVGATEFAIPQGARQRLEQVVAGN